MNNDIALLLVDQDKALASELSAALNTMPVIMPPEQIDDATAQKTAAIFGVPSPELLARCPRLKWVQLPSAGADPRLLKALPAGVSLTCSTGGYGHAVSEHLLALTLELLKKLHLYRDRQLKADWKNCGTVKSIQGAVVAVLGLGDIGGAYARKMKALGAYIIGICRSPRAKPDYADELFATGSDKQALEHILPRADVLAMVLPGTAQTEHIIGARELSMMKNDAVIVNAGRGSSLDTDALCDALEAGRIGGAALDVTDPEPLPPEHRLWKLPTAVITPHVAGWRYMKETGPEVHAVWLRNARHFAAGEAFESVIDRELGYAAKGQR
jgi:phosphoglycerate dehydrogenase-like enzyme